MKSGKRQIVLHVGQSKAGSTSIQNFLESRYDQLLQAGFLFARTGFSRKNAFDQRRSSGHLVLLRDLKAYDERFAEEIAQFPDHTVILSAESTFFDLPDAVLAEIAAYFKEWDLRINCVLRPQCDWLRSRYVENVVSGFIRRSDKFDTFTRDLIDRGALDYEACIARLMRLLQPRGIQVLQFDSGKDDLLPRFVEAVGLPLSVSDEARTGYANHREKPHFLIESKRRLNFVSGDLDWRAALELEHRIRQKARALVEIGQASATAFAPAIPANEPLLAHWRNGNDRLTEVGLLDGPLEVGEARGTETREAPDVETATDRLFWTGLGLARQIAVQGDASIGPNSPLSFSAPELAALQALLSDNLVSLHLDDPASALLAACARGRLVRLVLGASASAYGDIATLDAMDLPSPLVALTAAGLSDAVLFEPRPDILVAGPQARSDILHDMVKILQPRHLVVRGQAKALNDEEILGAYRREQVGECAFLSHMEPARTAQEALAPREIASTRPS